MPPADPRTVVAKPVDDALWIREIAVGDVFAALRRGLEDFRAIPTHSVLFGVFYAVAGLLLVAIVFGYALAPLIVPLIGGFAIVGPFAAVGHYALSRRREAGLPARWWHMAEGYRSRSAGVFGLGLILAVIFLVWMSLAAALTNLLLGALPTQFGDALAVLFTTGAGWTLMLVGSVLGLAIGAFAFAISVVAFPLIVDRDIDPITAAQTSLRAVALNPGPMAVWAMIVAGLLALGALPALLGLAVVLPILGHATWHLYRKVLPPHD